MKLDWQENIQNDRRDLVAYVTDIYTLPYIGLWLTQWRIKNEKSIYQANTRLQTCCEVLEFCTQFASYKQTTDIRNLKLIRLFQHRGYTGLFGFVFTMHKMSVQTNVYIQKPTNVMLEYNLDWERSGGLCWHNVIRRVYPLQN